jgi:hypothetical protein
MAKKKAAKKQNSKQLPRKTTAKKSVKKSAKMSTRKRELIDTGNDKRYVRRDDQGRFNEVDDMGRSLSQDRRRKAKTAAKPGQGDRGDRQKR